jgi:hypothetical protein
VSPNTVPLITSSSRPPRKTFAHGALTSGAAGGATLGGVIRVSTAASRSPGVGSVLVAVTETA